MPIENKISDPSPGERVSKELTFLLSKYRDKRVLILGTTCTGKSTLMAAMPGSRDQDAEVFPKLTPQESAYVCQTPWTEEIGTVMTRLVRERVVTAAGQPLFGTVVLEADILILLNISDALLRERTAKRGVKFEDAKAMGERIRHDAKRSGIPCLEFSVG